MNGGVETHGIQGPSRGTKSTVRITPTTGAGVVLAIALGALPAALVGLELAWLVVVAALSVLVVAPWMAWREARAIVDVVPPRSLRVHAGRATPVTFEMRVVRPCRDLLVDVTLKGAAAREREAAPRVAIDSLVPTSPDVAPARIPLIARFPSRGTASGLQFRTTSTFPFGLFTATKVVHLAVSVRILPRLQPRPDAGLMRALQEPHPAGPSNPRPRPLARAGLPAGLRGARSGDRLRDIAWKPSLRQSRWIAYEREGHESERQVTLVLQLGVRGSSASSLRRTGLAFEAAVSHCATAIEWLFVRTGAVRLELNSTPADAPLPEIGAGTPDGEPGGADVYDAGVAGPGALMDRLSEVQPHLPHQSPSGNASAPFPAEPSAAPRPRARLSRNQGLRIVFIAMSALEFQRATDRASDDARGAEGTLILGVDANGRVQPLLGGPSRRAPRRPTASDPKATQAGRGRA